MYSCFNCLFHTCVRKFRRIYISVISEMKAGTDLLSLQPTFNPACSNLYLPYCDVSSASANLISMQNACLQYNSHQVLSSYTRTKYEEFLEVCSKQKKISQCKSPKSSGSKEPFDTSCSGSTSEVSNDQDFDEQENAQPSKLRLKSGKVYNYKVVGNKSIKKITVSGAGSKRQHNNTVQSISEDSTYHQQPPFKKPFLHSSSNNLSKSTLRQWETLSSEIWQRYLNQKQDDELYCRKIKLWNYLFNLLKETFPYCGLYVVGSSMTGLSSRKSDVDMCLMLSHAEIDQKSDAMKILKLVANLIRSRSLVVGITFYMIIWYNFSTDFHFHMILEHHYCLLRTEAESRNRIVPYNVNENIQNSILIRAKVPILNFYDSQSQCNVDLNINNAVGIRNTQLLKCYADCDWRVRPLVLIVKAWANKQGINDARTHTLSSYSIVLMVIHFLQYGVEPNVLPCLQKLFPNKFVPDSDVRTLSLNEHLPVIPSRNKMSLGELLMNFLDYYANAYNYKQDTMSVRLGCVVPTYLSRHQPSSKNTPAQWNLICIEEPFDYTNTAKSVYDCRAFNKILKAFQSSYHNLKKNRSLSSILLKS